MRRTALIAAFVRRYYLCHSCGEAGLERRETDPGVGVARHVVAPARLLLSSCAACDVGGEERRRAATRLDREVVHGLLADVWSVRLVVHLCSRPACCRPWHHIGGSLPFVSLGDPHDAIPDRRWHPCPWCVAEDLAGAATDHDERRRDLIDLGEWEAELRRH